MSRVLGLVCLLVVAGGALADKAEQQRAAIQEMRTETLAQLYGENPDTKEMVAKSAGYAVFSNTGMNLFVVSTGNGAGVVRDNASGSDTYMKMLSAGGGFGMGVKKFRGVFIFHSAQALNSFVTEGWDFSAQADAAATMDADEGTEAGALDETVTLKQGVSVYQLTDKGLALQATLQGTKYWVADGLN